MIPGVVIAGTHSGSGKTTVTLGLLAWLAGQGFEVQGFKVGPDFIDPSFYQGITGRPGENLDSWMTSPETVKRIYRDSCQGAQVAVVEGVMGLFDGAGGASETGSTAEIAKLLNLPVIMVIDARSMGRSVAALIKGFSEFDRGLRFGGIIFNRVGSERHQKILMEATKEVTGLKILGSLPRENSLALPERHLGLVPFYEKPEFQQQISQLAGLFQENIDLNSIQEIFAESEFDTSVFTSRINKPEVTVRIGVARDEAFGFYYQDNLRRLEEAGAEIVPFSPLHDETMPPELDGLYIGGGYPEIFAKELAANQGVKDELKRIICSGVPTYAECGGLMYLGDSLRTTDGVYPMLGVLNLEFEMSSRREVLGYTIVTALKDNLLLKMGETARGHEFHYSRIIRSSLAEPAYLVQRGETQIKAGYIGPNILASYIHLHFGSNSGIAARFVERCRKKLNS